ncbi:hypothetical protein SAMN02745126_00916 [Enhydrobacter aerosaccus]|uniref:Uncharacterized protein n=1 Tax=Enhydrobacter aerosaccus TaxID=225324 RepID=A0A1T4KED2_9HYPH|nr:hypothetical protein [Enhydrobacter aerosaccus]SJZ40715.1 hypothetical protein SAMN02745126_00916 [Enhydrobacter aerosaccus]
MFRATGYIYLLVAMASVGCAAGPAQADGGRPLQHLPAVAQATAPGNTALAPEDINQLPGAYLNKEVTIACEKVTDADIFAFTCRGHSGSIIGESKTLPPDDLHMILDRCQGVRAVCAGILVGTIVRRHGILLIVNGRFVEPDSWGVH